MHNDRISKVLLILLMLTAFAGLAACSGYDSGKHSSDPSPTDSLEPTEFVFPTDLDPEIRKYFITPTPRDITPGGTSSPFGNPTSPPDVGGVSHRVDSKGYSLETVVDYFGDVALNTEYGDNDNLIHKWTAPIVLYIKGSPTAEDRNVLQTAMQQMNSVYGFPGIRETIIESDANLVIHFANDSEYKRITPSNINDATDGFASCWWDDSVIYKANIGIRASISQHERNSVIWEELVQCTGLQNDSYRYPDSLFYQGYNEVQGPNELDWLLFELLYHPEMKPGISTEEALFVLSAVLK